MGHIWLSSDPTHLPSTQLLQCGFERPAGVTPSTPARWPGHRAATPSGALRVRATGACHENGIAFFILFLLFNSVANRRVIPLCRLRNWKYKVSADIEGLRAEKGTPYALVSCECPSRAEQM